MAAQYSLQEELRRIDAKTMEDEIRKGGQPLWCGARHLVAVHKASNEERLGIVRAAALGSYTLKWQKCLRNFESLATKGIEVEIGGLTSSLDLNGTVGVSETFDLSSCRIGVRISDKRIVKVKEENLYFNEYLPFYQCPFSPLCCREKRGECTWAGIRQLIVCGWFLTEERRQEQYEIFSKDSKDHDTIATTTITDAAAVKATGATTKVASIRRNCILSKLPEEPLRIILEYARLHRVPSVLDLPERCRLQVHWKSPDVKEEDIPPEEKHPDKAIGAAGRNTFEYLDPYSLAMEFHTINSGRSSEEYQAIRCGLIRLVTCAQMWWSGVLHYQEFKTCLPFGRLVNERLNLAGRTSDVPSRLIGEMRSLLDEAFRTNKTVKPMTHYHSTSFLVSPLYSKEIPKDFIIGPYKVNEFGKITKWLCDEEKEGRDESGGGGGGSSKQLSGLVEPVWFKRAKEPWDRAFKTMFDGCGERNSINCYFYAAEIGCATPKGFRYPKDGSVTACKFLHDTWWKDWVEDVIKHPRLCSHCGIYGEKKCSQCKKAYYCSINCQRRCWAAHKKVCVKC